jgi:perosamine synthetase
MTSNKIIQYGAHFIDDTDIAAVNEVLRSDVITQGTMDLRFGEDLARFTGAKYSVPVSSGSAALHLALAALDIKKGDEVITCPLTFCATANAILYQDGTPVFVDINPTTLNIDHEAIEKKINSRTRAILPIDFRGHPAPLAEIRRIADKHGLKVIEDAAHSIGSTYESDGNIYQCGDAKHADLATFSFHPVKHITTGEGGAVMMSDESLFRKITNLKKHGIDRRPEMFSETERRGSWVYDMESLGYNYRLTDFQSALGIQQLKRINQIKKRRRELVIQYNEQLRDISEFVLPFEDPKVSSNFHLYIIRIPKNKRFDRYDLYTHLYSKDIRVMVHYIPVHLLSYYRNRFGYKPGDYPVVERYYEEALTLPLYPQMSDDDLHRVVSVIKNFIANR